MRAMVDGGWDLACWHCAARPVFAQGLEAENLLVGMPEGFELGYEASQDGAGDPRADPGRRKRRGLVADGDDPDLSTASPTCRAIASRSTWPPNWQGGLRGLDGDKAHRGRRQRLPVRALDASSVRSIRRPASPRPCISRASPARTRSIPSSTRSAQEQADDLDTVALTLSYRCIGLRHAKARAALSRGHVDSEKAGIAPGLLYFSPADPLTRRAGARFPRPSPR